MDEAAYLERPALIEAALTATGNVRIDISTPCNGSLFNEWASRSTSKFVVDISDVPWHTDAWVKAKRDELEGKGLKHVFAQEFLRDGTAGLEGQLIPGEWVEAAVDACTKLAIRATGEKVAALDVADGGKDRSALTIRYGVSVDLGKSRSDLLADGAGAWVYAIATQRGCQRLLYDNIGVGAGAAAALRGKTDIKVRGWNAAGAVVNRTEKYQAPEPTRTCLRERESAGLVGVARSGPGDVQGQPRRSLRSRCHHQPEPGDRGAARAQERAFAGDYTLQRRRQGYREQSA